MKINLSKFVSVLLCMVTVVSLVSTTNSVYAAYYSTAYPNTHVNTGIQCEDIMEVAYTQIGYAETGSNITKYNEWMSQATGYSYQGVSWCAIFVCWCANEANVSTSVISRNAGCTALYKSFDPSQIHHQSDGYIPRRGDICFLASSNTTNPEALAHVGLVYGTEGSNIKIIEGNCGGRVQMLTRPQYGATYSGQYVVSYATPKYASSLLVTDVTLSTQELSLKVGDSGKITAEITPSDAADKTLTFTSSDETVAKVNSDGNVTAIKAGTAKITVKSSNGISAVCNVIVGDIKELSSIEVVELPTKTSYYLWETFSPEGMKVIATYTDSTTFDVSSKCTVSGASTLTVGEKTATVKYTEDGITKTATFNIIVKGKLKTIVVTSMPTKTNYYVGERLDTTGIQVVAIYSDGSVKTVTDLCVFSGFDSSSVGTKDVKVSYSEEGNTFNTQFSVRVNQKAAALTGITVENAPAKTEYLVGETLKTDGIKVVAAYSNGTTKDVTSLCSFSGFDSSKPNENNVVTVTYKEGEKTCTTTFDVSVISAHTQKRLVKLEVISHSLIIRRGASAYNSRLKVLGYYDDTTTADVTSSVDVAFNSSKRGIKKATVLLTDETGNTVSKSFYVLVV